VEIGAAAKRKRKVKPKAKRKAKLRCTTPQKKRKPKALKKKAAAKKLKPKARRAGYGIETIEAHDAAARRKRRKKVGLKKRRACAPKKKKKALKKQPTPQPPAKPSPPPPYVTQSPIAVYGGPFGRAQAERLFWRAGFGPSPGWPEAFAAFGLEGAVNTLVYPLGEPGYTGAAATDNDGNPLQPEDLWGHDHCFWLDRMVRTNHPLVERMALIWHDWFATSDTGVGSARMMLEQYELFRAYGRGSFEELLRQVTINPAMLTWLNGIDNRKSAINENYAREVMELFTLGADRGAYSEQDVRQLARSLSGWRADWTEGIGLNNFRFDSKRWDSGVKTVFGKSGAFGWEDAYRMCVQHPLHPSFFVTKLWSYFIPTPPSDAERQALEQYYVASGYNVAGVVRAILLHPQLYEGPRMVKPPVVFNAGLLRALARPIDRTDWVWLSEGAGQRLFWPPDVAGWNDERWLDTSTIRGRWDMVRYAVNDDYVPWSSHGTYGNAETPDQALGRALGTWSNPEVTAEMRSSLQSFASTCMPPTNNGYQQNAYRAMRQNALLQLIATSPDLQTS
jgi:uncharacterized protein (DUF1800 family)